MDRRYFLKTYGLGGIALAFAAACGGGSDDDDETEPTVTATARTGGATATVGAESASTTVPAGDNPFDDYTYENTETGTHVRIYRDGDLRRIEANGLPDHATGDFPNARNPNAISAQDYAFQVPADPAQRTSSTANGILSLFGIAINGVVFDPGAAEFWNNNSDSGWQYEALSGAIDLGLDGNNAHVQPTGGYHYHGIPTGMVAGLAADQHSPLVGFAADGFPVYVTYGYAGDATGAITALRSSFRVKDGTRPDGPGGTYDGSFVAGYEYVAGLGDLDENNGRFAVTPEYPEGTYYHLLTEGFPFIPRSFAGTPDASFARIVPAGGPTGGSGRP